MSSVDDTVQDAQLAMAPPVQSPAVRKANSVAVETDELPYRLLIEHANDGIVVLQNGRYMYQNSAHMAMLGYSLEELSSWEGFWGIIAPEDRERVSSYYHKRLRGEPVPDQYSADFLTRSGRRITAEVKPRCIIYRGQPATLVVVRDITLRQKAEQELQQAHQRTLQLLEAVPSILIALDADTRIVWWNKAAEALFGYPPSEMIGRSLHDCGTLWDNSAILPGLATCEERETAIHLDNIRFKHRADWDGFLEITISPIASTQNEEIRFLMMAQDITSQKHLEDHLGRAQKLESIGQLAAGIAHEINTPMQYIGDNTRFLHETFHDLARLLEQYAALFQATKAGLHSASLLHQVEATVEAVDVDYLMEEIPTAIQQSLEGIERVTKIVQAMKDFSHPGSEAKTAIDLNRAIDSTIMVACNEWKYVAEMVTDFDPSLLPVECLPGELNQVVLNLIVNAAHTIADVPNNGGQEKGTITISTLQEDGWVTIRITDTGMGIPEAIQSKIFDPFFTTKDVGKGTGQGLAIAHNVVVQKHGGTISFETVEGEGTTFIIRLPLEAAAT